LAELQVDAGAEPAPLVDGRRALHDDCRLLDAEDVRARVVGAEQIDTVVRAIAVELVVAFERDAELQVLERVRRVLRRILIGRLRL
jgi:hypothetical protein